MSTTVPDALAINRAFYAAHAQEYCRKTAEPRRDETYRPFAALLTPGARVLDAGCGSGRDSVALAQQGFRVTAIDASPEMVREACARGVDARVLTFQEMEFASEFDGIWACASLLHVPRAEIPGVLRRFHRALRSPGVLYVSLKDGTGEGIAEEGRFFSYFTLAEFGELLTQENFRGVKAWQSSDREFSGAERSWVNFLGASRI
ncbi:MAG: class I SAM-dependent methyltransferase [Verrucomicrobia bacterium]|nr:class I SAM-dependent methyltransferase [Verrucomicrobiota bacterium]